MGSTDRAGAALGGAWQGWSEESMPLAYRRRRATQPASPRADGCDGSSNRSLLYQIAGLTVARSSFHSRLTRPLAELLEKLVAWRLSVQTSNSEETTDSAKGARGLWRWIRRSSSSTRCSPRSGNQPIPARRPPSSTWWPIPLVVGTDSRRLYARNPLNLFMFAGGWHRLLGVGAANEPPPGVAVLGHEGSQVEKWES